MSVLKKFSYGREYTYIQVFNLARILRVFLENVYIEVWQFNERRTGPVRLPSWRRSENTIAFSIRPRYSLKSLEEKCWGRLHILLFLHMLLLQLFVLLLLFFMMVAVRLCLHSNVSIFASVHTYTRTWTRTHARKQGSKQACKHTHTNAHRLV